jgi:hypothetical protein
MSKLLGANWQTTLTGGLQALFTALVTGTLTFPKDWHSPGQVFLFALVVIGTFFGFKFAVATKSKDVTGGSVQQTVDGKLAEPGTQTLVDQTVIASIKSGETVTPEQKRAVQNIIT